MKRFWVGALGLSLGWWAPQAGAEELQWRPAAPRVAILSPAGGMPKVPGSSSPVTLGRPTPLPGDSREPLLSKHPADPGVRLTSFSAPANPPPRVVRAKGVDNAPGTLPDFLPVDTKPAFAGKSLVPTGFASDQGLTGADAHLVIETAPAPKAVESAPAPNGVETAPVPHIVEAAPPSMGSAPHEFGDGLDPACPGDCGCSCGEPLGSRFWGSGEYIFWKLRDSQIPTLVTTGTNGTGFLGQQGTVPLLGPGSLQDDTRSGARFRAGYWIDPCQTWGVEGSFFVLQDRSPSFLFGSNQFNLLARPFINELTGGQFSQISTRPDLAIGTLNVDFTSQFWGAEANLRYNLRNSCNYRVDLIGGLRYLDLKEGLATTENLLPVAGGSAFGGDHVVVSDHFSTHNQFYGGQLGAVTEFHRGKWFLNVRTELALGETHQSIDIAGSQTITNPNGTVNRFAGGALALFSNSGNHSRDVFGFVPEVGLNLGYQLTNNLRVYAGYNFLYWSEVVRPGDQIDTVIDPRQIPNFLKPGPGTVTNTRPIVPFKESSFWAQGANVGLEFRY